ncbi:MAG: alpha-galactosidase [Verrucomicrobia bacterium]|nr:alpha-galactosidase [Verrucomicrobiota bacterium]
MYPLSNDNPTVFIKIGATALRYRLDPRSGSVDFLPLPAGTEDKCTSRPATRPSHPVFADRKCMMAWEHREKDPLVQVAVRGLPYPNNFSTGETMRDHFASKSQRFKSQEITCQDGITQVTTRMISKAGFETVHTVTWHEGDSGFLVDTSIINCGNEALEVEMLSSFSLADMTPFAADDAPDRLKLHRFRSVWSNEAIHTAEFLENLQLERTWGAARSFCATGKPQHADPQLFPIYCIGGLCNGSHLGTQVAWHGSWQMEIYRRDDGVHMSGGHGDFERAHWMKRLQPGEKLDAPTALVASAHGGIDPLCRALLGLQQRISHQEPEHERELPIIFNEWCSTWGKPSHDYLMRTAEKLAGTHTKYLVIDDGWAERPEGNSIQFNGDWNVNTKAFPGGLKPTCDALRAMGIIPGLWYEFEPCTQGTEAHKTVDHLLHRNGKVLDVGNRRFWDFRDPWTFEYLTKKVIHQLRDCGFGYLKVDYNESIGLGCDGAESLGEGLRQHLLKVKEFFAKIRTEIPDLVIENCSSGGHREEPGMIALTSMCSFSDAHETVEIPIISASLQRLIPVAKLQIWAVLRPDDSLQRLDYSLAATFLGRMCISGDVVDLDGEKFIRLKQAQDFYVQAVPVLRDGISYFYGQTGPSRRYPKGWQAVVRVSPDGKQALVVLHTFDEAPESVEIDIPATANAGWRIAATYGETQSSTLKDGILSVDIPGTFYGMAWLLCAD